MVNKSNKLQFRDKVLIKYALFETQDSPLDYESTHYLTVELSQDPKHPHHWSNITGEILMKKVMKVMQNVAYSEPELMRVFQNYNPSSIIRVSKTGKKGTLPHISYMSMQDPVSIRSADDLRLKMVKKYELQYLDEDITDVGSLPENTSYGNPNYVSNTHPHIYFFKYVYTAPPLLLGTFFKVHFLGPL